MTAPLDVLVFSSDADAHTASVVGELRRLGRRVGAWCASDLHRTNLTWTPGEGTLDGRGRVASEGRSFKPLSGGDDPAYHS